MPTKNLAAILTMRQLASWRTVFLFAWLIQLAACATNPSLTNPPFNPGLLPLGVGMAHITSQKTDDGWVINSGITRLGDGTKIGRECGASKTLDIGAKIRANIFVVRAACQDASLNADELKWLDHVARYYAAAVEQNPVLRQFFDDLGPITFDWYLIEYGARFILEKPTAMNTRDMRSPRLALAMTLPAAQAENEVLQVNATIGVTAVTHEYFHALSKREEFQFERPSLDEVTAYFLGHATAIEMGMLYEPTPSVFLEKSLEHVWEEALVPAEGGVMSSIAGQRLAHVMMTKARQCASPNDALRGTARLVYTHVREHKGMRFEDLKKIDNLSCEIRQANGDGGIKYQCKGTNKDCTL